jgi:hypothetical protein
MFAHWMSRLEACICLDPEVEVGVVDMKLPLKSVSKFGDLIFCTFLCI